MHSRILIREFTSDHGKPKRNARPISQTNHVTRIEWFRPRYHGKSAAGFRFITSSTDEEGSCPWGKSSSERRPDRAESYQGELLRHETRHECGESRDFVVAFRSPASKRLSKPQPARHGCFGIAPRRGGAPAWRASRSSSSASFGTFAHRRFRSRVRRLRAGHAIFITPGRILPGGSVQCTWPPR
jgi:hypothetical protein